jgi:hypothetical protein
MSTSLIANVSRRWAQTNLLWSPDGNLLLLAQRFDIEYASDSAVARTCPGSDRDKKITDWHMQYEAEFGKSPGSGVPLPG